MPKLKAPQDVTKARTPTVSKPDPWNGPWGKINPSPQSTQTLRLCKGVSSAVEESFSYPYRSLSSWHWRREFQQEVLKIEAGPDMISLRGKGLIRLMEALDLGALETIREGSSIAAANVENAIVVESLTVEKASEL